MTKPKKILFVETAHSASDDRVYWHQKPALEAAGHDVQVVSTLGKNGREKLHLLRETIRTYRPDIAICDTPYAVMAAKRWGAKHIIYDVTEWNAYPPMGGRIALRWQKKAETRIVSRQADALVYGEEQKAAPYRRRMPEKPHLRLPYYPSEQYIRVETPSADLKKTVRLFYAGPATQKKGYYHVLAVARALAERCPDCAVKLTLVVPSLQTIDGTMRDNLTISQQTYCSLPDFCRILPEQDIYLDLRDVCGREKHSLPIKLFLYMANGRPMIYSPLSSIRRDYSFVRQVKPEKTVAAVDMICDWMEHPALYGEACQAARETYLMHCRWEDIAGDWVRFVEQVGAGE